jgi:uroporphyrinogen-III synthase
MCDGRFSAGVVCSAKAANVVKQVFSDDSSLPPKIESCCSFFTVGDKSADILRELGLKVEVSAPSAAALIPALESFAATSSGACTVAMKPMVFFCAPSRLDDIPSCLARLKLPCIEVFAYETAAVDGEELESSLRTALDVTNGGESHVGAIDGGSISDPLYLVFFSPSGVDAVVATTAGRSLLSMASSATLASSTSAAAASNASASSSQTPSASSESAAVIPVAFGATTLAALRKLGVSCDRVCPTPDAMGVEAAIKAAPPR